MFVCNYCVCTQIWNLTKYIYVGWNFRQLLTMMRISSIFRNTNIYSAVYLISYIQHRNGTDNNNNNNNNNLIYIAPACRMTSEALERTYSCSGISFIQKFWRVPTKRGCQIRVGNLFHNSFMCDIQYVMVMFSFDRGSCHRATWCLHVFLHLFCWINLISEAATLFCNKWHTRQNLFCCCVVFGCCFKLDFCRYMWHRF